MVLKIIILFTKKRKRKYMDNIINDINKNDYLDDDIKKELIFIYQSYQDNESGHELKDRVDNVLERIFRTAYTYAVPMDFINSPIGTILFRIKLDIRCSIMYGFSELMILANKSKPAIFKDYHSGTLTGIETGKNKRVLVTEEAAYEYITTVGRNRYSQEEARLRIRTLNKMIRSGASNEDIIEVLGNKKLNNNIRKEM